MTKKFWIALSENPFFTKDDHYIFYVFYGNQGNGKGYPLLPKFIESEDIEDARRKLHAFVDERIDHELHMEKMDAAGRVADAKKVSDEGIDSLTISGPQSGPTFKASEDLLDLFGTHQK